MPTYRWSVAALLVTGLAALPAQSSPPADPQSTPAMDRVVGFYDSRLDRVVLVGGAAAAREGEHDRAWTWNGTRWEPLAERQGPPARTNGAAAFDSRMGAAIVAGGARQAASGSAMNVVGDTWILDRSGWRAGPSIDARDHHAMVTDARGAALLFGGIPRDRRGPWPSETWELKSDGQEWTRIATEGPSARARTALTYDSVRRQVVLFGGVSAPSGPDGSQAFFADTWVWADGAWMKAADAGPRGRYAHGMVFDERAGVVLLYSGSAAHRNAPLSDMWKWDGRAWTEIPLEGPTPGHRYQPVLVYDRARQRTVLFGGRQGSADTWEWDGRQWREIR